jgi:hypothetical protein
MIQSGYIYTVYIIKPFELYLLDKDLLTQILVSCPLMSFIYKWIEMQLSLGIDKIFDLCKKNRFQSELLTWVSQRVSLVGQEMFNLPEHQS